MCYNNSRKKAGRHSRPPYGVLAQLGERKVRNLEVRGSIPLCSTNFNEKPIEISTFRWVFCCFAFPPSFHIARDDTLCSEIPCMTSQPARDTLHGKLACARFSKCAENDIFLTKSRKQHTKNPISKRKPHISEILYDYLVLSCVLF